MRHEFDMSSETLERLIRAKDPESTMDEFFCTLLDAYLAQPTTRPLPSGNKLIEDFVALLRRSGATFVHTSGSMNVWEIPVRFRGRIQRRRIFVSSTGSGLIDFPNSDLWMEGPTREQEEWKKRGILPPQAMKNGKFSGWRAYPRIYVKRSGENLETAKEYLLSIAEELR
jgi:hypothetical protein